VKYLSQRDGRHPLAQVLGGDEQQDASEFFDFITRHLDDETNVYRDREPSFQSQWEDPTDISYPYPESTLEPTMVLAPRYWKDYSKTSASILDKYFRSVEVEFSQCKSCRHQMKTMRNYSTFLLDIAGSPDSTEPCKLEDLFAAYFGNRFESEARCDRCKKAGRVLNRKIARLPERMVFVLSRFRQHEGKAIKVKRSVEFPFYNLNLSKHFVNEQPWPDDPYYNPKREHGLYNLYAVVSHRGDSLSGGHYVSYVRNYNAGWDDWLCCSDAKIDPMHEMSDQEKQKQVFGRRLEKETALMLFYEREKRP
jgi:ubiquitin carboxyl-terminal hydrolase 8